MAERAVHAAVHGAAETARPERLADVVGAEQAAAGAAGQSDRALGDSHRLGSGHRTAE